MADAVLVVLGTGLSGEEFGELLVEVNEVLRVLPALELVLKVTVRLLQGLAPHPRLDTYCLEQRNVCPATKNVRELPC